MTILAYPRANHTPTIFWEDVLLNCLITHVCYWYVLVILGCVVLIGFMKLNNKRCVQVQRLFYMFLRVGKQHFRVHTPYT